MSVQMSVQSEFADERKRLTHVLDTIKADLGALRAEARTVEMQIARKRAAQADVLSALSMAYARQM